MFPWLTQFTDFGLLAMRLMVALVFVTSGWSHVTRSDERSKSIGMSKGFTIFLGLAEMAGAPCVAFGVLTQLAALGLILIVLGAISEENLCLAYRFLGRENLWLSLRFDVGCHVPGNFHQRRALGLDEIIARIFQNV